VFPNRPESLVVLRRAIAVNPEDATARFLLGSLHLASGLSHEVTREWQEARRLDKRLPVLHRNLGRTLLHLAGDVDGALATFLEGMESDPWNVDLYHGADQAMSLLGRPPQERITALVRFPDRAHMPSDLLQRLALALTEVGRAEEGETLLAGGFFPREEGGTNVRQVWVEVRLQKALALARADRGADAMAVLQALDHEVPGVAFTKDGLAVFVRSPRIQYTAGEVAAQAGDSAAARRYWEKAAESRAGLRTLPWTYQAARRLDTADEPALRQRMLESLAESEKLAESGTALPGVALHAQGLILRALGREDDARARFRQALLAPDQQLSHFLSRRALAGALP
jgi:tetratricopeptide (TPR) repeat protein